MAQSRLKSTDSFSPFLVIVGSLAILAHLGVVIIHALAAPSGPWIRFGGPTLVTPPAFAESLDMPSRGYLNLVRLTHNYHFMGNRPAPPGVYVEIQLKDAKREPMMTLRFPDPDANAWVRHRQELFVQELVPDQPIAPPAGEAIPAPHQDVKSVPIWDSTGPSAPLRLHRVPEHLIPRRPGVYGPTDWSLILVRSYARYLCRKHGAASAEVVRHSRQTAPPMVFLMGEPPPDTMNDLVASYGDMSRE